MLLGRRRARTEGSSIAATKEGIAESQSRSDVPIEAQGKATRAQRALTPPWVRETSTGSHNVAALIVAAHGLELDERYAWD